MAFAENFVAPPGFRADDYLIRPLHVTDNQLDYDAVMESKEFLRIWEQSSWPEDDFTAEANLQDMQKMVQRHADRHSFGYTVMNLTETECYGCIYIAPTDVSWLANSQVTPLADAEWSDFDTSVSFWVRQSQLANGLDRRVLDSVHVWMSNDWPIRRHAIMTVEQFDQQVTMIDSSDLQRAFRLVDPKDASPSLAFI